MKIKVDGREFNVPSKVNMLHNLKWEDVIEEYIFFGLETSKIENLIKEDIIAMREINLSGLLDG